MYMTITYKKRSIKKARNKKKVFGNKKQTHKRCKNKWSLRRKRGGMDNGDAKKVTDSSLTQRKSNKKDDGNTAGHVQARGGEEEEAEITYVLCNEGLVMLSELLKDINDVDIINLDIQNLSPHDITALIGNEHDGDDEVGDPPKTPPQTPPQTPAHAMVTRSNVIKHLIGLLVPATPQKLRVINELFKDSPPKMSSLTQEAEGVLSPVGVLNQPSSSSSSSSSSAASAAAARDTSSVLGTPGLSTACSNENFIPVLVSYLNIKRKRWNLSETTTSNCWENLFDMFEKRGFKPRFRDRIVEYSETNLFDQTKFSRAFYQQFVIDCVDFGVATELNKLKNIGRDAFSGEALKSAAVAAANARDEFLYTDHLDVAHRAPEELEPVEIDWINECIQNRNQFWIDNPDFRTEDGKPNYTAALVDMKEKIKTPEYNDWKYWKIVCGICWICKKPIYFYYMTKNSDGTGKKINLTTQCGQIEHVLPPTVGDIHGSLHTSASIFKKVVNADRTETMYTYGLAPSHAFCNQMKGMFVFTPILFGGNVHVEWREEVNSWFKNERYDSFEFYPGFIDTWDGFNGDEAETYENTTLRNVDDYLKRNILPILQQQAAHPGHTTESVTQLKLAIFCQKFAYEHSDIFKKKWDGTESSGAARGRPEGR